MTVLGAGPGPENEKLKNFCGSGSEKLGPSATLEASIDFGKGTIFERRIFYLEENPFWMPLLFYGFIPDISQSFFVIASGIFIRFVSVVLLLFHTISLFSLSFPLSCAYIEIPFFSCSLEERRK